jgi:hypothetical protein
MAVIPTPLMATESSLGRPGLALVLQGCTLLYLSSLLPPVFPPWRVLFVAESPPSPTHSPISLAS